MTSTQQTLPAPVPAPPPVPVTRAQVIKALAQRTPATAGGLPQGIYRADMLPVQGTWDLSKLDPMELEAAYVELSFAEGFPALPNGAPFWHKWEFEPAIAYSIFQLYLDQIETGPRQIHTVIESAEVTKVLNGQAQTLVMEWAQTFYWQARARAHDIYKEAAFRQIRARRALYTEDRHYEIADKLLQIATDYMATPDFVEQMSPKTALEALKLAAGLQRVSVGLPAAGPLSSKEEAHNAGTNFEMIIRQVGQRAGGDVFDQDGKLVSPAETPLNDMLTSNEDAQAIQEIIIRMSATSKGREAPTFTNQHSRRDRTQDLSKDVEDVEPGAPPATPRNISSATQLEVEDVVIRGTIQNDEESEDASGE